MAASVATEPPQCRQTSKERVCVDCTWVTPSDGLDWGGGLGWRLVVQINVGVVGLRRDLETPKSNSFS